MLGLLGIPIFAMVGGTVESIQQKDVGDYGAQVVIISWDGKRSYSHLEENSITVAPGQVVKAGDVIGKMGKTGRTSGLQVGWGVLHIEMIVGGKKTDPCKYAPWA